MDEKLEEDYNSSAECLRKLFYVHKMNTMKSSHGIYKVKKK